ncbi:MAG: DUF4434 domain-containing protein [Firmicutes bacterium]|nr:DUF4434 domain-containing protein [Bacillota bacterium]MDD4693313.1 DUF4434 domain-containing protein [Bacillota bacterium]
MLDLSVNYRIITILCLLLALFLVFPEPASAFKVPQINKATAEVNWLSLDGLETLQFTDDGFLSTKVAYSRVEILYNFEDFDLSFEAKVNEYGTHGSIMLILHEQDTYAGYSVAIDQNRATVMRRHGYWNDYQWLANINGAIKPGNWHHIRLTCKDQVYTYYLDGKQMGQFEDQNRVYNKGSLVIRVANSKAEIRNVEVTAENKPALRVSNVPLVDLTPDRVVHANAAITGSFLQLDYTNIRNSKGSWENELKAMKDAGLDLLVVPAYANETGPLYDVLDELFAEANKQGISIMIGTLSNRNYNWTNLSKSHLTKVLDNLKADVTELYNRYGENNAFYGWYLSDEIDEKDLVPSKFSLTTWYYSEQINHIKSLTPGKPILLSPSYEAGTSPIWWEEKFDKFLEVVKVDILGPQDSVGAKRSTPEAASKFYRAFLKACQKHDVQLWADVEIFDIDTWHPAELELVKKQLFAVEPYVEKVIVFEFNHYMNPYKNARSKKLYNDYVDWIK